MIRKFVLSLVLLFFASGLFAQETLRTLTLSTEYSTVAGTPRVVRNGFKQLWVVVWRQGTPGKLLGKIIQSNGTAGAQKTLISGVSAFEGAFDIAYDAVNYTYLIAFENARGLNVQFYNQNFVKVGQPVLIEGGVSNTTPRIAYDGIGKKFVIFYVASQDGTPRRILRNRLLDVQGKPTATARDIATAAAGKVFGFTSVSTNSKNGNMIVMIMHNAAGSTVNGELLGYSIKQQDGSKLKAAPLRFQPNTAGFNSFADTAFATDGTGFAFWADRTAVKFRKLNATMGFAGAAKSMVGSADANSISTSMIFDSRNNQYLPVWTRGNEVVSAALNTATGAVSEPIFGVADSTLTNSRNAATSYDPSQGNALVVWEDSSTPANTASTPASKFRVRSALFFVGGAASTTTISVGDNFYSPSQLRIKTGTTVTWVFNGNNPHTVTSSNGNTLSSGTQNQGARFTFRFSAPGTYQYFCTVHGQSMSGTVVVTEDQEPPTPY